MRSVQFVFLSFCLLLSIVTLYGYHLFSSYFNSGQIYVHQISKLQKDLEAQSIRYQLVSYQFLEFQQNVASLLPVQSKIVSKNNSILSFQKILRAPAAVQIDTSFILFESAKHNLKDNKLDTAYKQLTELTEQHPLSPYRIESYYKLAEISFQQKDYKKTISDIEKLVDLFPESEWAGYGLLLLGDISQRHYQYQEAEAIYKLATKNFSEFSFIQEQAQKKLQKIKVH